MRTRIGLTVGVVAATSSESRHTGRRAVVDGDDLASTTGTVKRHAHPVASEQRGRGLLRLRSNKHRRPAEQRQERSATAAGRVSWPKIIVPSWGSTVIVAAPVQTSC
jgi:hypothetical protein